jgi:hypothetical protein
MDFIGAGGIKTLILICVIIGAILITFAKIVK